MSAGKQVLIIVSFRHVFVFGLVLIVIVSNDQATDPRKIPNSLSRTRSLMLRRSPEISLKVLGIERDIYGLTPEKRVSTSNTVFALSQILVKGVSVMSCVYEIVPVSCVQTPGDVSDIIEQGGWLLVGRMDHKPCFGGYASITLDILACYGAKFRPAHKTRRGFCESWRWWLSRFSGNVWPASKSWSSPRSLARCFEYCSDDFVDAGPF